MNTDDIYKILLYLVLIILVTFIIYKIYQWYVEKPIIEGFNDSYELGGKRRFLWICAYGSDAWNSGLNVGGPAYYLNADSIDNTSSDVAMKRTPNYYVSEFALDGTSVLNLKSPDGNVYFTQAKPTDNQVFTLNYKSGGSGVNGKLVTSSIVSVLYNNAGDLYYNLNYYYSMNTVNTGWTIVSTGYGTSIADLAAGKIYLWITDRQTIKSRSTGDWSSNDVWVSAQIPRTLATSGYKLPTRIYMAISNNYGWLLNTDGKLYYAKASLNKINPSDGSAFNLFTGSPAINPICAMAVLKDFCIAVSTSTTVSTNKTTIYICSPNGGNYKTIYLSSIIANNEVKEVTAGCGIIALIVGAAVYALNMAFENTANNVWKQLTITLTSSDSALLNPRNITMQPDWTEGWFPSYYHVSFNPDIAGTTLPIKYNSSISAQYISLIVGRDGDYLQVAGIEAYDIYGNEITQDPASSKITASTDWAGALDGNWPIISIIDGLPWTTYHSARRNDWGARAFAAIRIDLGSPKNIAKIRINNRYDGARERLNGTNIILRDANNDVVYTTAYNDTINDIRVVPNSTATVIYEGIYQDFLMPNIQPDSYVVGRYISFIKPDGYFISIKYVEVYDDQDNLITNNYPVTHSLAMLYSNNTKLSPFADNEATFGVENLTKMRTNLNTNSATIVHSNAEGPRFQKILIDLKTDKRIKRIKIWSRTTVGVDSNWQEFMSVCRSNEFYTVIQNSALENVFVNTRFNINDNNNRYINNTLQDGNEQHQTILTNKLAAPILASRMFVNLPGEGYALNVSLIELFDYNNIKYTVPTTSVAGTAYGANSGILPIRLASSGLPITSDVYICKMIVYVPDDSTQRPNRAIFTFMGLNSTESRHTLTYTSDSIDSIDANSTDVNRRRKQTFILYNNRPALAKCGLSAKLPRGWFNLNPLANYAKVTPESTNIDDYKYFCAYTNDANGNIIFACNDPSQPANSFILNNDGTIRNFDPYAIQPYYDFYGNGIITNGVADCPPNAGLSPSTFNLAQQTRSTFTPAPTTPAPTTPAPTTPAPTTPAPLQQQLQQQIQQQIQQLQQQQQQLDQQQQQPGQQQQQQPGQQQQQQQQPTPEQLLLQQQLLQLQQQLQQLQQPPTQPPTIPPPTQAPIVARVSTLDTSGLQLLANYYQSSTQQGLQGTASALTESFQNQSNTPSLPQTLESAYNAQQISIIPSGDSTFKIQVDDQCLSVYGDKDYMLKKCNATAYEQRFKSYEITNANDAQSITGKPVNIDTDRATYPYSLVSSTISNNCLDIDEDGIRLTPCNGNNLNQQWNVKTTKNVCIANEK